MLKMILIATLHKLDVDVAHLLRVYDTKVGYFFFNIPLFLTELFFSNIHY